ncbi:MAG: rhomboid family intramembrane serine protease [Candidatus Omnitrophica bacterium]|nr:rhomboid family intramembrane serine protease [Candidatus Omnitrophota bacterium]MDD5429623.1 rhomboid family intramembrane serine protease [Candidatus Omnitrophota bacterium]
MTKSVKVLIIINIAIFFLANILPGFGWARLFGLVPAVVFSHLRLWQIVTYMFLHIGLWHLVLNMLMLWFFGPAIETAWGRQRFVAYYLFTGIVAGFCSFLVSPGSYIPVIGASGAIFGLLTAYAFMFPEATVVLFFIFPMKMHQAVFILAGINLLGAVSNSGSGIAYIAHLGGALAGYLYMKNQRLRDFVCFFCPQALGEHYAQVQRRKKGRDTANLNKEVDRILDKISKQGIDSLSRGERIILERKSRDSFREK